MFHRTPLMNKPLLVGRFKGTFNPRVWSTRTKCFYSQARTQTHTRLSNWRLLGVGILILGSLLCNNMIYNDVHAIDTSIHELEPAKDEETYEMGLYLASQREETDQFQRYRKQKLKGSKIFGPLYYLKFAIDDYIIDPLITLSRFVELSMIFLPVLISAPICWFGKHENTESGVRSGAKIWFKYLRWSAELGGASFIKLGQWAASRTDIFPKELCDELGRLHSNAKAHSLSSTKKIVSESFGLPFDEIFDEFNEKPLGVGAIAQVYIAKLSNKALKKQKLTKFISKMTDINT